MDRYAGMREAAAFVCATAIEPSSRAFDASFSVRRKPGVDTIASGQLASAAPS